MKDINADYNTALMSGGDGPNYAGVGTKTTEKRWNVFVVNEDAVITTAVFVRQDKVTVAPYTADWFGVTLTAGMYINCPVLEVSAGVEERVYLKSITVASGSIILYMD